MGPGVDDFGGDGGERLAVRDVGVDGQRHVPGVIAGTGGQVLAGDHLDRGGPQQGGEVLLHLWAAVL